MMPKASQVYGTIIQIWISPIPKAVAVEPYDTIPGYDRGITVLPGLLHNP